jgi:hypothetical protein
VKNLKFWLVVLGYAAALIGLIIWDKVRINS